MIDSGQLHFKTDDVFCQGGEYLLQKDEKETAPTMAGVFTSCFGEISSWSLKLSYLGKPRSLF